MRLQNWGEQLPNMGNFFASVKKKGDSITFRIAQPPVYTGKHFTQTDEGWVVTECPRINNPENSEVCELCEQYFEIMKEAKVLKEKDSKKYEDLRKKARPYNVAIQYYFPILNRDTKQFQILRTTLGVRNKLDEQYQSGVSVMESDWILRNTGSDSPRDLYSIIRKDSSEVEPFDEKEIEEFQKAVYYDMLKISDNVSKRVMDDEADNSLVEQADEIFNK
jgi:hypothetical protein